jgi:hypothetical protein
MKSSRARFTRYRAYYGCGPNCFGRTHRLNSSRGVYGGVIIFFDCICHAVREGAD